MHLQQRKIAVLPLEVIRNHSKSGLLGSEFRLPFGELLGGDYVFCHKVSPTDIAVPVIDEDHIRTRLHQVLTDCKRCGNHVELIMKDNHTIANKPENVYRWVQIAKEEIAKVY